MDKKKKIIGVLITLTIIFTVMGSTFAYLSWSSSEEQKTQVTFTKEAGFSCSVNGGGNIAEGDVILMPTVVNDSTTSYYIKRTITVNPTITDSLLPVYMDLWLDINSLGTGLSNSLNFKYALTTSSTSPTTGVVSSGNFNGKITGDKINLLTSKEYTATTTDTYYLWIWLDAEETSSETMNQSFSLSLNGSCSNEIRPYSENILNGAAPILDEGMISVVFDTTNGTLVKTINKDNSNWYNYSEKKWANAVLVTEESRSNYLNTSGVTVSEDDILAYYVWIPRYKYKIWTTEDSSTGNEQEINIIFEGKNTPKSVATQAGEYHTHPAFTFGTTELDGIWVGKFETGGTATAPLIKPDIRSLRNQKVSEEFTTAQIFGTSTYGMTSNVDAHMMKNSEWGAVAYLSHSRYGANREIYINNSSGYYTGRSGGNVGGSTAINTVYTSQTSPSQYNNYGFYTWDGYLLEYNTNTKSTTRDLNKVASTTGNITGVYDMSGGTWECVMGYYSPASSTWGATSSGIYEGFSSQPNSKYYDDYTATNSLTACNGGICYGHGLSEVGGWYGDYDTFVDASNPWFLRGGNYNNDSSAGTFRFSSDYGGAGSVRAARSVLVVGRLQ